MMNRGRGIGGGRGGGEAAAAAALMGGTGAIRSRRGDAWPGRPLEMRIAVGPDDRPKGQTITI